MYHKETEQNKAHFLSRHPQASFLPGKKVREERCGEPTPRSQHLLAGNVMYASLLPLEMPSEPGREAKGHQCREGTGSGQSASNTEGGLFLSCTKRRVVMPKEMTHWDISLQQYPEKEIGKEQDPKGSGQEDPEGKEDCTAGEPVEGSPTPLKIPQGLGWRISGCLQSMPACWPQLRRVVAVRWVTAVRRGDRDC
ncbi:hypothetical protein NDU88_003854 [Pleurodeles waltl]|uniref:Uncharacterized protein n=1 Tax=Pleurodeles waltl TaxID=8319 RepID=A0AAV7RHE3_PLEWA|nr:hypothetical protein NDU88_003854 [Pleurodeles waltl]